MIVTYVFFAQVLTLPSERLLPANPDILDGVDDLIQMSYLNEPSVLYNLQFRYSRDLIYVRTVQQAH
jgi:myosin-5